MLSFENDRGVEGKTVSRRCFIARPDPVMGELFEEVGVGCCVPVEDVRP